MSLEERDEILLDNFLLNFTTCAASESSPPAFFGFLAFFFGSFWSTPGAPAGAGSELASGGCDTVKADWDPLGLARSLCLNQGKAICMLFDIQVPFHHWESTEIEINP